MATCRKTKKQTVVQDGRPTELKWSCSRKAHTKGMHQSKGLNGVVLKSWR